MLPLIIDPTFIPNRFGIWDLRYSVNLIKNDRAKRYNKSVIHNPQSKLDEWLTR